MRRSISSTGTGSETSSYSLQYVHERLHRRMGTICAMYGWPVETSALPIEVSSRTLRVAAFQRRRALIWRLGVVVGTKDMVRFQYIEPHTCLIEIERVKTGQTLVLSTPARV